MEIPLVAGFGWIVIVLFLGLGLSIIALSFREFARAKTSVRPDRGANALIRTGPFAYSRNPLYVAVVLLILGIGVWVNSIWIWVMVAPLVLVMNTAVIIREERHLE
ncbi:MAG: methyltransferase, partial [Deltaproteobacteria bacterium]|nr:methyltransferase [Deltaproteobacteria bacterium]